jgi:hypothetical protein
MKKSINDYQIGRAGYEKDKKPMFADKINSMKQMKDRNIEFQVFKEGGPDYEVKKDGNVIAYFEAEFPLPGRWRPDEDFRFPTIRWPKRKYDHYIQWGGLYNGKPLFMITIKSDLTDCYYIDAKTWFQKGKEERVGGSVFYGIDKNDPDLGHGLQGLVDYMLDRIKKIYGEV